MRIPKGLAVASAGVSMAAAVAIPAVAHPAHPASKGTFKSSVSPNPVHSGQTLTLRAHGAKKHTSYTCVLIVLHGANYGIGHIIGSKTSSRHGKFKCSTTFEPFKAQPVNGGKARHCPTTRKDRKAGWKCGFAASTPDKKSNTVSYFKAKK